MKIRRSFLGPAAKLVIKHYLAPALPRPIEETAPGHPHFEHLLQTQCLCAELYFVRAMALRATALVLDRCWRPTPFSPLKNETRSSHDPPKLHHIGPSRQPQPRRAYLKASHGHQIPSRLVLR